MSEWMNGCPHTPATHTHRTSRLTRHKKDTYQVPPNICRLSCEALIRIAFWTLKMCFHAHLLFSLKANVSKTHFQFCNRLYLSELSSRPLYKGPTCSSTITGPFLRPDLLREDVNSACPIKTSRRKPATLLCPKREGHFSKPHFSR